MKNNILLSSLPDAVLIDGITWPVRCSFRVWIQYDSIVNSEIEDVEKIEKLLRLFYPQVPVMNLAEAIEKMLWFYRCGREPEREDEKKQRYQTMNSSEPAYSFEQDSPYIYAAFREQYDIDLSEQDIHWWKFMALFESLSEDTKMSKIMYYRKARTSGMSKDRRAFINEMKKLYRINRGSLSGRRKMTLEDRNRKWRDYVLGRQKEIK